ncbi:MAG: hypothetical protein Q9222_003031 [Ikaeria aurantiellina]
MSRRSSSGDSNSNWKPWQFNVFLLPPVLLIGFILAAILFHLVAASRHTLPSAVLQEKWFAWYQTAATNDTALHFQQFKDIPLDFHPSKECRQGLVDLNASSSGTYFYWNFLPSILATFLAVVWALVDSEVKRIEPFYQASRPHGASARSCLFAEYITLPSVLSPFQAIYWGHGVALLSAVSTALMTVITPVVQAFIFQSAGQGLYIGFMDDPDETATGNIFTPFDAHNTLSDYISNTVNLTNKRLTGRCATGYPFASSMDDNSHYLMAQGALYQYMYVPQRAATVQATILLIVFAAGLFLLWHMHRRTTGMRAPYGDVATLAALATVDPAFLGKLKNTMDLNRERAKAWRSYLSKQRVYLGLLPSHPSIGNQFGFHFGPLEGEQPQIPHGPSEKPRKNKKTSAVMLIGAAISLIVIILNAADYHGNDPDIFNDPLENAVYFRDYNEQSTALQIVSLILLSFGKNLWKVGENHFMTFAYLGHRDPRDIDFENKYPPSRKAIGRDYSRMTPFGLIPCALVDGDIVLLLVTFIGICWEAAIMVAGFLTSISISSGVTITEWKNIWWATVACILLTFFMTALAFWPLLRRSRMRIGSMGGLASHFEMVANSADLLDLVRPLREIYKDNERIEYLRRSDECYAFGRVTANRLSGGYTYGLTRIR